MSIRLCARPVLQMTSKAAQVRLHSGKVLWFPLSQCPELVLLGTGKEGEFTCPRWIYEREDLRADAAASSRQVQLFGRTLSFTQEAAFVEFRGGEQTWLPFAECPGLLDLPVNTRGPFLCPELLLNDKELLHYAMDASEVSHQLRKGSISLSQAINGEQIPNAVLHQFAHDCAYHILHHNAQMDTSVMLGLWKLMQCKRQWMADHSKAQGLYEERKALYDAWGTMDHEHLKVAAVVWDATESDPHRAALQASRHLLCGHLDPTVSVSAMRRGAHREKEEDELLLARQWQCTHLASLLETSQPKAAAHTQKRAS